MSRTLSIDSRPSDYAQKVSVGGHVLPVDEPAHFGGCDIGPNPQEYLMAALGACASITALMYAKRKRWNLQSVHIDVGYERVLPTDDTDSGAAVGMSDRFEMEISLVGDLSEQQRNRLFEVANRCPIHRILTSSAKIQSRLVVSDRAPQQAGTRER
jgi:putative redox protein